MSERKQIAHVWTSTGIDAREMKAGFTRFLRTDAGVFAADTWGSGEMKVHKGRHGGHEFVNYFPFYGPGIDETAVTDFRAPRRAEGESRGDTDAAAAGGVQSGKRAATGRHAGGGRRRFFGRKGPGTADHRRDPRA